MQWEWSDGKIVRLCWFGVGRIQTFGPHIAKCIRQQGITTCWEDVSHQKHVSLFGISALGFRCQGEGWSCQPASSQAWSMQNSWTPKWSPWVKIWRSFCVTRDSLENVFEGEDLARYKYHIAIEGNCAADRVVWQPFLGSVLLIPDGPWVHVSPVKIMQPWVHYVPVMLFGCKRWNTILSFWLQKAFLCYWSCIL